MLKKQRGKVREVFIGPMPDNLDPANNVINVMSETGELIFMQRHGFMQVLTIDKTVTLYTYVPE
jgi:hypothetical protein